MCGWQHIICDISWHLMQKHWMPWHAYQYPLQLGFLSPFYTHSFLSIHFVGTLVIPPKITGGSAFPSMYPHLHYLILENSESSSLGLSHIHLAVSYTIHNIQVKCHPIFSRIILHSPSSLGKIHLFCSGLSWNQLFISIIIFFILCESASIPFFH